MIRVRRLYSLIALFLFAAAPLVTAKESQGRGLPAVWAGAQRVLFVGDSITYAGGYVDFVAAAVRLTAPDWKGEIVDVGLPSETVSGLSEPGHAGGKFPRPDLHERLGRVLAQIKPDLVIACYGMNDGIYLPYDEERFRKFQDGVRWLHETVTSTGAAIVHATPPVYDPQPAKGKHPEYDPVLARFSEWLLAQRERGWTVIDLHGPMAAELAKRRAAQADFFFAKDGVHPDRLGHAVMARALLSGLGFSSAMAEAPLTWAVDGGPEWLRTISARRKLLSDAWLTATGHQRPGMAPGKPVAEAEQEAARLDREIRAAMAEDGAEGSKGGAGYP